MVWAQDKQKEQAFMNAQLWGWNQWYSNRKCTNLHTASGSTVPKPPSKTLQAPRMEEPK